MDEFVNYLVNTLGDSQSENGIKGYSLDNEPALWRDTHPRVHPDKAGCAEVVDKSKSLAKAIKTIDPNAEIFGPALFGYGAYTDFSGAADWTDVKQGEDYRWFIDYYLDEMKKAVNVIATIIAIKTALKRYSILPAHFGTAVIGRIAG